VLSMCACKVTLPKESRNKSAHFLGDSQIIKPTEQKELIVRQPSLNKLKVIKPQIITAKMKKDESTFSEKMDNLHEEIFAKNADDSKQDAEIIEKEKSYSKFDMIMFWLAITAGCTLVWCSIWFIGRTLIK